MANKRIKNTALVLSLTSVLAITTGCSKKQGIESSRLSEEVTQQTQVLGEEDIVEDEPIKEDINTTNEEINEEPKQEETVKNNNAEVKNEIKPEEFKEEELQEAKQDMKESFEVQTYINEDIGTKLTQEDIDSLKLNYENLVKYNDELEQNFSKYQNLTQEDYNNIIKIIDNMTNEINTMNKVQNNSDDFKGILINTMEGLSTTQNYILQSRNQDTTSEQVVILPELLKECIDVYNDNMADILVSINSYLYNQ